LSSFEESVMLSILSDSEYSSIIVRLWVFSGYAQRLSDK
jgi:hypothetical protein